MASDPRDSEETLVKPGSGSGAALKLDFAEEPVCSPVTAQRLAQRLEQHAESSGEACKSGAVRTPPLESTSRKKAAEKAQRQLDLMLELCVNGEAAGGLDVRALIAKLQAQDRKLEAAASELQTERAVKEQLLARVQQLEKSDRGELVAENEWLKSLLEEAYCARDEACNLLSSLKEATLQQAAITAPVAVTKKVWKKAPAQTAAVVAPPAPAIPVPAPAPEVKEEKKKAAPVKREPQKKKRQKRGKCEDEDDDEEDEEEDRDSDDEEDKKKRAKKDEGDDNEDEVREVSPPKRQKVGGSSRTAPILVDAEKDGGFCDPKFAGEDVSLSEAELLVTADTQAHYRSLTKGGIRFAIDDCVYLAAPKNLADFVGKILDIREDDKVGAVLSVQWYFRWDDLPDQVQNQKVSPLSKERELWLSSLVDENPASTLIGRFTVRDFTKVGRKEAEAYTSASPHNFFTRFSVDIDKVAIIPLASGGN